MKLRSLPSRQEINIIASAITVLIMHFTQAWHHMPFSYFTFAILLAPGLFAQGANKWAVYAIGVSTGMAISQGYVSALSTPGLSYPQWGILLGFLAFNFALVHALEYFVDRNNH